MLSELAGRHVVLLGIGHTNAHIVRMWGMNPISGADLTCLTDFPIATYSGMLPAVLAGQIPPEDMQIDLVRLCSSVGARLLTNRVRGVDSDRRLVHFDDRPSIPYDVLSVGIGSVPTVDGVEVSGQTLLKIKPMQTFQQRLSAVLQRAVQNAAGRTLRIVVVGSGVAGVEISFCLRPFVKSHTDQPFELRIVTRSDDILPGVTASMRRRVRRELQRCDICPTTDRRVVRVTEQFVELEHETRLPADLVVWATGATAPELLSRLGLPVNDRGFLTTDHTLRSTAQVPVFAVGDTGTIVSEHLPKAGVYAVRQGPVLWENIQRTLAGRTLKAYSPQRSFLKLLNAGNGRAIGEWKGFSFAGRWVMKLKDHIDQKFMRMYRVTDGMAMPDAEMQCRGCGCKLGGEQLEQALETEGGFAERPSDSGSKPLDDAAVIELSAGRIVASTDFFTTPFQDAFLTGRIAALHAASDLIATGASVKAALANVVVPEGDSVAQQRELRDLLDGARHEFSAMNATVVGGHTIVGPRWEVGFTVIGEPLSPTLLRKQDLNSGDLLYLTRPLGVGVLLAAHLRSQCAADDYVLLIDTMLQRQHPLAQLAADLGITAGTDITGFGLAGHLIEMLKASRRTATITLADVPLLPGVVAAIESGIESSLTPSNRHVEPLISASSEIRARPAWAALFDPQTCGGLLLGVSREKAAEFERRLGDAGSGIAACIGEVQSASDNATILNVV
ncbi:MAG: selenide, water dikinase SelD [Fuerstiella sp.]